MTAAERIASLDNLAPAELCARAEAALTRLVDVMNRETVMLRTGQWRAAENVTAEKAQLAQDYVVIARAVQRSGPRINAEAPHLVERLKSLHERFATQMAENLRVLATSRDVTENLLSDVAQQVAKANQPQTYAPAGQVQRPVPSTPGLSINRSL